MIKYRAYIDCKLCSDIHPMYITLEIEKGPVKSISIGELYKGKNLPLNMADLKNHKMTCPNTGETFIEKDNYKIYLLPIYPLKGGG